MVVGRVLVCLIAVVALGYRVWMIQQPPRGVVACLDGRDLTVQVSANAVKARTRGAVTVDATVLQVVQPECTSLIGKRLRLFWFAPEPVPRSQDRVRARIHVNIPWGSKNPGGFNYERWLMGQGFAGTGYIRQGIVDQPPNQPGLPRLRLARYVNSGLLLALTTGDRQQVGPEQWALFRDTGTIHLMVVSGLHVGILSGVVYAICLCVLRIIPALGHLAERRVISLWFTLAVLVLFALSVGAQAPVLRAVSMAAVAITLLCTLRAPGHWWRVLVLVGAVTLLLAPRFAYQQGFWLSFLAVALLLFYLAPQGRPQSYVRLLIFVQLGLFVGLSPWVGLLTGAVPIVSPLANILVLPLMTLVVIPSALLGGLLAWLPVISHVLFTLADVGLSFTLALLQHVRLQPLVELAPVSLLILGLAVPASLIAMLPLAPKIRLLAVFGWLPLCLPLGSDVVAGEFDIHILDVGQGSAALISTSKHRMVVDVGVSHPGGFDAGAAIVVPAVFSTGPNQVDLILLSHLDNDHAGGLAAVQKRFPGAGVKGLGHGCEHNDQWTWDGVKFRILVARQGVGRNDRSCTLLVSNGEHHAYFSGDISQRVETRLISQLPRSIDLLVAPHHGSAGSSSKAFVEHLAPRFVVFSAGRYNRYNHPRPEVVARYAANGALYSITGLSGAVYWYSHTPYVLGTQRCGLIRGVIGGVDHGAKCAD